MSIDITPTLNQITALPVSDQIELLHQAWDRLLDSGWQPNLTDELKAELDHRLDASPADAVPLAKVIEHVRRQR